MISFKKKIIAGLLSGALLFTGGLALDNAQAAQKPAKDILQHSDSGNRHERPQMTDAQINEAAKNLADMYGVNQTEVATALKNRVHFGDIEQAAMLSKLSGKSFSAVLAMKCDWRQVAEKLGVTQEQYDALMKEQMTAHLAEETKLDKKTVESLLNENYDPRDIRIAGAIANESGKSVKTVLAKRKINNDWRDVAKEFNVDFKKIADKRHGPTDESDEKEGGARRF